MDKIHHILNRAVVLYAGLAILCAVWIDPMTARLKVLNFHRNSARYVNQFALRPDVDYDAKKFYQAAIYQRGLVRLLPDQTLSHGALGYIYAQQGKYRAAARAYDRAVRHHPELFGFHFNRALVYYQLGDMARAEAALDSALTSAPAATLAHHRAIAARMFPAANLREAWLQEKLFRLKSAHTLAARLKEHIRSGERMVIDAGQYYYYVPPIETGIIPLQAVVDGARVP